MTADDVTINPYSTEAIGVEVREMGEGDLGAVQEVARITRAETYREALRGPGF